MAHELILPRTRTEATLEKAIELLPSKGQNAALEAVKWLIEDTALATVAGQAGMSRSDLHVILTVSRGKIMHKKRRALEPVLNLLPGGLGLILAVVEDHIIQEEENGSA